MPFRARVRLNKAAFTHRAEKLLLYRALLKGRHTRAAFYILISDSSGWEGFSTVFGEKKLVRAACCPHI
jgi:hypothetical protein